MLGLSIGDPVTFRRHPGDHWQEGRVVGRSRARAGWFYDVEPADGGDRAINATDVKLDERRAAEQRAPEVAQITAARDEVTRRLIEAGRDVVMIPIRGTVR